MKVELFDFQESALRLLRQRVRFARQAASPDNPQVVSFSSPTGSGKTVMMTALLEDILHGHEELPEQPDAVVLWLSDMPELNEQSRLKIEATSSRIRTRQLVKLDASFDKETLEGGRVYFLNSQKLGEDKRLTRGRDDARTYAIWETLTNTVRAFPGRFYVVIDEAHRGMRDGRGEEKARSIVQRFIKGSPEHGLVPMPLVIGLSATPQRFEQLLAGTTMHTVSKVHVPPEDVKRSGLIKDRTIIDHPEAAGEFEVSLLQAAAAKWAEMERLWDAYCKAEGEPPVRPILVVQVEDAGASGPSKTDLAMAIDAIEKGAGRALRPDEVVHAFTEPGDLSVGGRTVRKVEASRIQGDASVGVVLFKMGLTTGWDCPRAEVMMSFRPGRDHTYVAQLLGRMVRTPLARRIDREAALNDVHLFLPHFDEATIQKVVEDLRNVEEAPPVEAGSARELVTLQRRADAAAAFEAMDALVTYRVNAVRRQSSLRRLHGLARALTFDKLDKGALAATEATIVAWLGGEVARLKAEGSFDAKAAAVTRVSVQSVVVQQGTLATSRGAGYAREAADEDVDVQFSAAGRRLGNGLHVAYWKAHAGRPEREVKVEVAVLGSDDGALTSLEAKAEAEFERLYAKHQRDVKGLKEPRRQHYERLYLSAEAPKPVRWLDHLGESIAFRRTAQAPAYARHLFLEPSETFKANLGTWEAGVLEEEMARKDFAYWLRNVERQPWALEIPYREGSAYRPMFPDLLVVRKDAKGFLFDVLEPHDPSLKDNRAKAIGLADFAQRHGHLFGRIQVIRKKKGPSGAERFYRLDVNDPKVRAMVQECADDLAFDRVFEREAKADA